ncbi:DUF2163 domain-containing protein [Xanthobacter autotrophicus]|uniref:DUF2163 domain-containing protein n=1 Tax=Xanthobacter autotrophicus TaxID=280 RepID=UPI0024A6A7DE|nr:DUF2163 domain-containing protein [Xanthobacter autotrophicus]MDI4657135.1 DUF2163 domain-containing protein [Xanthobacter autotrophicus]
MRTLPSALAAHLASGATTLCHGWRVTRRDGHVTGFTDHDRDLVVAGVIFKAASGISGSQSTHAAGLAVTGAEVSGALSHDALSEDDLAAGLYDGASIDLLLVNWQDPGQHLLLRRGTIGEVRAQDGVFTAEIRSLSDGLNQTRGRLLSSTCDADLGDGRCGVDLTLPAHAASATVAAVQGALSLRVIGLSAFAEAAFARGRARFLSGANAGFVTEVKAHLVDAEGVLLRLWQRPPLVVEEGDGIALTAGCDKQFATCRDRFSNALNFRGFPHMPGNDFVIAVAIQGEGGYDGSVLE